MTESGYPEGKGLPPVDLVGTEAMRDDVTVYAEQLRKELGISVGIRIMERGAMVAAANEGKLAFFISGWSSDYPDPLSILESVWYSTSPFNRSRWKNSTFDALIDGAKATPVAEARHALCREAERVLMADWAMIPLPVPMTVTLTRPGVTGARITPSGGIDLRQAAVP